jgi:7-cyano-7-deazaguanine tRNA-ribosyltransferase
VTQLVPGVSLKNLEPRVWDPESPFYIPCVRALMVSYAEIAASNSLVRKARELGLHALLRVDRTCQIYLDNGSFAFRRNSRRVSPAEFYSFVADALPGWYPVHFDAIPHPQMATRERDSAYLKTMRANRRGTKTGAAYVIHVGGSLKKYVRALRGITESDPSRRIAIGGAVPHILTSKGSQANIDVISQLHIVRKAFVGHNLHAFGLGSTATLHLARLLCLDSVDSSGYRNRAARGIIQLPGTGDREIAALGSWRGRKLSAGESRLLKDCRCPACQRYGIFGLRALGIHGFACRASHNLWVLYDELRWLDAHVGKGTYRDAFQLRLRNSRYTRLAEAVAAIAEVS